MKKQCRVCNLEVDAQVKIMPETSVHYAKAICPICGTFIDWIKKPDNAYIRTKSSKYTPEILGIEKCSFCGRTQHEIGRREVLEVHHEIEIQEGGKDEESNITIYCTACHRLCHFVRTYFHEHLDGFYTFYNERNGK